ncbi:MAG: tetratricopeptide repeat protein [Deltaproteobacteria bacterium]|nr:tetratricopeptide repeat protein [Deltaproteobacteria bacterium]
MSVILDALRAKKKEGEEKGTGTPLAPEEGLFLGKKGFLQKKEKKSSSLTVVLSVVLVLLLAATGLFRYLGRSTEKPVPVVVAEPPTIMPAPSDLNFAGRLKTAQEKFHQGDIDGSLALLQALEKESPANVEVYNDLGLIFLKKKLFSSAEKYFTLALEKEAACAPCLNNFGYLKTLLNETVEAKAYLTQSIQQDDNYAEPHFNLAVLYEKNGEIAQAVSHYRQFLEKTPDANNKTASGVKDRLRELIGQ